jgi:hypothetical protein
MPVSSAAIFASGMRASEAASAAFRKRMSTCCCVNPAKIRCACCTRAVSAFSSSRLVTGMASAPAVLRSEGRSSVCLLCLYAASPREPGAVTSVTLRNEIPCSRAPAGCADSIPDPPAPVARPRPRLQRATTCLRRCSLAFITSFKSAAGRISHGPFFKPGCWPISSTA